MKNKSTFKRDFFTILLTMPLVPLGSYFMDIYLYHVSHPIGQYVGIYIAGVLGGTLGLLARYRTRK